MNKSSVALLALVVNLSAACGAAPPAVVTRPGDAEASRGAVASAPAGEARAASRPVSFTFPAGVTNPFAVAAPSAPAAERAASCVDASSAKGFYGFYRTDPWERGDVVLTFDDGPHPKATPRVLDLLKGHGMPATFFVVGRAISRDTYPIVQRIVAEGHALGSHSYSHDVHMTRVSAPEATIEDIRGQHEATAVLVDLALLAKSGDDFDAMFTTVFQRDPATWLTATTIRREREAFSARHRALLLERGLEAGARPYTILYSRPPGGGPYVERDGAAGIALYDAALAELGMMNVMWHGASGDTVPEKRSDFAFLTENLAKYSEGGGVLLIHDYIRPDALAHALDRMAKSDGVRIETMADAVERKYGCGTAALAGRLRDGVSF